jgi:hypothetical protein
MMSYREVNGNHAMITNSTRMRDEYEPLLESIFRLSRCCDHLLMITTYCARQYYDNDNSQSKPRDFGLTLVLPPGPI